MAAGLLFVQICVCCVLMVRTDAVFHSPNTTLNRLVVDQSSGHVFIGAVNHLYELDSHLNLLQDVQTGPVLDNVKCYQYNTNFNSCTVIGSIPLSLMDNTNKLLLLNSHKNLLLSCGTIYQGTCEWRTMGNLSNSVAVRTPYVDLNQMLATNTPNTTYRSVAFTAQGPDELQLYVGTSSQTEFPFRKDVPFVSAREMTDTNLDLVSSNDFYSFYSKLSFQFPYQRYFRGGFSYNSFSYFVAWDDADQRSKLIRICQNNSDFAQSYVEMPLECYSQSAGNFSAVQVANFFQVGSDLSGTSGQTDVMVGVFWDQSFQPRKSAVCVYTMQDINNKFVENLQSCQHTGNYLKPKGSCSSSLPNNFCGSSSSFTPLAGSRVMTRAPIWMTRGILTSLDLTVVRQHTVAFLGNMYDNIFKVRLIANASINYGNLSVPKGETVLSDTQLDENKDNLLVLSDKGLYQREISNCSAASTCQQCVQQNDPFCGWCTLQNMCVVQGQCASGILPGRWLPFDQNCWNVVDVVPKYKSVSVPGNVTVILNGSLPSSQLPSSSSYWCKFGPSEQLMIATLAGNRIMCDIPGVNIPGTDVELASFIDIIAVSTNESIFTVAFTFYNCARYTVCSQCTTTTSYVCRWCVQDGQCVDDQSSCSNGPQIIKATQPNQCPQVLHNKNITLIPEGFPMQIRLQVINLPTYYIKSYGCHVHNRSPPTVVPALWTPAQQTIICQSTVYNISSGDRSEVHHITIDVFMVNLRNNTIMVEDTSVEEATLYSCPGLGSDCSLCESLSYTDPLLGCTYCDGMCKYSPMCTNMPSILPTCPDPTNIKISPNSALLAEGTLVTVTGVNLGTRYEDVKNAVWVMLKNGQTVNCTAIQQLYQVSSKIVCVMGANSGPEMAGTLYVKIGANGRALSCSDCLFYFREPKISSVQPLLGPVSGGTTVTITGSALLTGGQQNISVAGAPCVVDYSRSNDTSVICTTSSSVNSSVGLVVVSYEGNTVKRFVTEFTYLPDPVVFGFYTIKSNATGVVPQVFPAGGVLLYVSGSNLDIVQMPKIYLEQGTYITPDVDCMLRSVSLMVCPTPVVRGPTRSRRGQESRHVRQTGPNVYTVGFRMDNVMSLLADNLNMKLIVVGSNPVFDEFANGLMVYQSPGTLELTGTNLNLAVTAADVKVTVGSADCVVRSLDAQTLFCTPPEKQPLGPTGRRGYPNVTVTVGNLQQSLGELEYNINHFSSNVPIIIGAAVGGFVLVMLIVLILIVYKRKSNQHIRQYKKLQQQLDMLESNVRNECKQAFAELQTEVSDFTSDINHIGIPYRDYKTYTFKILFPSQLDHPVRNSEPQFIFNKYGQHDLYLQKFLQLLNYSHFLLPFVKTLDQQKNFNVRDKALVASFLIIVLQDKMEYATEILQALLSDLIHKSVEKKSPKLMLRRTESVVEKFLTNWLSICMHGYVKHHSGRSLYMLCQAIKKQTEKGPIDALTAEAKYSLSEDRLLRHKVDTISLTLHIAMDRRDPISVKVLSCDTITQAKQKCLDAIFLNAPFSTRPCVHEFDLEWRSGRTAHLPLQDEDVTTDNSERNWKRINTLAHYHVPDGAVMALVPHNRYQDTEARQVNGRVELTVNSSSVTQPLVTLEMGSKPWHLVKQDDNNPSRSQKVMSEIFLTRLLTTKGTIQQYIDELFTSILDCDSTIIPPAIKWLFDLLDREAQNHGIIDPDVTTTWKSNSLPLRFWVNIMKNPDFVFDIEKSHIMESCLTTIAQTFMDSCSTVEHRLSKDSPSNKLLFARDIPRYRTLVSKYYKYIQDMPPVSDREIERQMTEASIHYAADFNVPIALKELFHYAQQYSFEILEALEEDPTAKRMKMAEKFDEIVNSVENNGTAYRNTSYRQIIV